jgi:hypothetical protein
MINPAGCPILLMGLLNPVRPVMIEGRRVGSDVLRQTSDIAAVYITLRGW